MNDYNDLMNEYEEIKNEITEETKCLANAIIRIKSFQAGLDIFRTNILMIPEQNSKYFKEIDESIIDFSNKLLSIKNLINNDMISPLNGLSENANFVSKNNLDIFNNIKITLIQERQKLNKTKDDYINFISKDSELITKNEDENLFFNAKKENYFQLYKYEVNQMNTIIQENNNAYQKMYNDINNWREINKTKIWFYLEKLAQNIEKVGNYFIDCSKNMIKAINEEKEKDRILKNKGNNIKNPRFEKIIIEDIDKKEENKIETENKKNSDNVNDFFDFDIVDVNDIEFNYNEKDKKTSEATNKKKKGLGIFEKINPFAKKDKSETNLVSKNNSNQNEKEESKLSGNNKENNSEGKYEKIINDIINKMIGKDELLSQDIRELMKLLKMENSSTKKLYSYTFLRKLREMNKKYIINLNNRKNFMHLSNILNDIVINDIKDINDITEYNIDILKLIIEISQIIIYKDLYLFNILRKKNQYLSTKTFWSKIIMNFFINDLNKQSKIILKNQKKTKEKDNSHSDKSKETNIYLLEYIKFSNQITNYKKLNTEQKIKLDQYARNNIPNVLTKVIEGMCSFYVKKNIIQEVIHDFGKIFGFKQEDNDYYNLLSETYLNRNYIFNLKKLSLQEKSEEKISKIIIISNVAKFLPKNNFINLLHLEKYMTEPIKKNIFKNFLSENISIDERTRLWGLMLGISQIKKDYNYTQILNNILKSLENNEIKKDSEFGKNIETIILDVNRTFLKDKSKSDIHQKSLKNILMCLVYIFKDVGYFQGMNYIAAFLFQVLDLDEETTFYYMLAIQKNTKFEEIFQKNLYLLTMFFEVFKKILKIYIPEIYQHEINNDLNENYYMPPWFLTLFMFSATAFDKKDAPKFIFLIMEDFFLNGWSAIFNAGYTVIQYHRNEILGLKLDKLLHYMVNNFAKEDAKNENYENIKKLYIKNSFKINEELISKLLKIKKYEENKNLNI